MACLHGVTTTNRTGGTMRTSTTQTAFSLKSHVNQIVADEVERFRELSTGATVEHPHAGLLASVDTQRNRYVSAAAAQAALSNVPLDGRAGTLLDASTDAEIFAAIATLEAVRITVVSLVGETGSAPVEKMRAVAIKRAPDGSHGWEPPRLASSTLVC